jgi:hypothetical protein
MPDDAPPDDTPPVDAPPDDAPKSLAAAANAFPPMPAIKRFSLVDPATGKPIVIEDETHFVTERDFLALRAHLIETVGHMRHASVPQAYTAFSVRGFEDGPAAIVEGDTRFVKKSDALALRRTVVAARAARMGTAVGDPPAFRTRPVATTASPPENALKPGKQP